MPIIHIEKPYVPETEKGKNSGKYLPTISKWKGVNFVRIHSFLAAAKEIVKWAEEIDVTKVGIVGDMHSGKSTMAEAIAHAIHDESNIPWTIRKFYEKDLMDFENTLKNLRGSRAFILIFDDVSFLDAKNNKKQISIVKEAITKIRHLEGGIDVKIIIIYNYHYTLGLDKFLRMSDFRFFTTAGSEEMENFEKIVGSDKMKLVREFSKMRQEAITKKHWRVIVKKQWFHYKWRDPFIPVLFWNNNSLRLIISPTRQWIQPICSICSHAIGEKSQIDVKQFVAESAEKFSLPIFKTVVKQVLKEQGINAYSPKVVRARKYLDLALQTKTINLEQLALFLKLKATKANRSKKLDGVLLE